VKKIIVLWHASQPVGICVFATPAAALKHRTRYFQLHQPRSAHGLSALNEQLWLLQRIVLHPTYRGAGLASAFVRRACELCPVPWIESLSAMGQVHPFFERAGFVRVGRIQQSQQRRRRQADPYRFSEPVYFIRQNL
jgi:N-acetylglutamate synthase-like GNAT family acetyltransferase